MIDLQQVVDALTPLAERYLEKQGFISEESKERIEDLAIDNSVEKRFFAIASVLEDAVEAALGDEEMVLKI